jgi:hypothetical protein
MDGGKPTSCVERIPDVVQIRADLARNQRERTLLEKLLRLAERKASLQRLNAEIEDSEAEVSRD